MVRVRVSFLCFRKLVEILRKFGRKKSSFLKKKTKALLQHGIFNRKGIERERVKREEEKENEGLERCCIITIFLSFSLPMIWLQFGEEEKKRGERR